MVKFRTKSGKTITFLTKRQKKKAFKRVRKRQDQPKAQNDGLGRL